MRAIKWWPRFSTLTALCLVSALVKLGGKNLYLAGEHTGSDSEIYLTAGVVFLVGALLTMCAWGLQHKRFVDSQGTRGLSPTVNVCLSAHGYYATSGVGYIILGDIYGWSYQVGHSFFVMVPTIVLLVGRERFFGLMAQQFNSDATRIMSEGAFIATLLDYSEVMVNQDWWVHRTPEEGQDLNYLPSDPHRNWKLGRITEINADEFVVTVPEDSNALAGISKTSQKSKRSQQSSKCKSIKFPLANRLMSAHELLPLAKQKLRCIDWHTITKQLIFGAYDSSDYSGIYDLSRPVLEGEVIDYFISYTRRDNAGAMMWEHLVRVAENFNSRHGRFPTFWLDKVCMDQTPSKIDDGLRVLPINLIACSKMLIMCGNSYLQSLWCVWELNTLFTILPHELAIQRCEFVPLSDKHDLQSLITNFDYRNAYCFDPNDQRKLLSVIETLSGSDFNKSIQTFASRIMDTHKDTE